MPKNASWASAQLVAAGLLAGMLAMAARNRPPRADALEQRGAPVQYMAGIARDVRKIDELGAGRGEGKFLSALGSALAAQRRDGITTQKLTHYAVKHTALGQPQTHEVKKGGDMGDEVIDFPIANRLHDYGDMHVPADIVSENSYTFKQRHPHTSQLRGVGKAHARAHANRAGAKQALRAVTIGAPAVSDPSDDSMYLTKLEKLGVNVGSKPSEGGFSTHGDVFVSANGLEESYSLGPSPQREHNANTIGGDFFGHVGDMPWTKEQIQAQARREHTQALAVVPASTGKQRDAKTAMGSVSNGWCQCAAQAHTTGLSVGRQCECYGPGDVAGEHALDAEKKKGKTMSLSLKMECCQCGGQDPVGTAGHPVYLFLQKVRNPKP